jgi:D-alanyl-D-alanine carboxypeptidase/D-alanyl-D-alanine-endopeptidase (penicillin-binding protein 4)
MRRWILPVVMLVIAGFSAWQAVRTDDALAAQGELVTAFPGQKLATNLASIRRTPEYLRAPVILETFVDDLDALTDDFPPASCLVVSAGGEELFTHNASQPLIPASAQKLVTAYGVYEILGADLSYTTRLVTDVQVVDGVLDGDLWLVGGGDPLLATSNYVDRYEEPQVFTDLNVLADALVAAGVTEITGAVIGDETRYDLERYIPEWPERFIEQNQIGPLSALTVNDGFERYDAVNTAPSLATASRAPAAFAAAFFDDLLEARDVVIRASATEGRAPFGARDIVEPLESEPIVAVTNQMLTVSDNMGAELLVKEIGLAESGVGTTDEGVLAIESRLRSSGFTTAETNVVDGSGLADNKTTCRLLVEILDASLDTTPMLDGLAVAGESGTLRERMVGTAAEGRVAAKTGRLNEVGALAGVAYAEDDTRLTFAWIGNTTDFYEVEAMMAAQDALALELVEYPEGPSVEDLAPLGSVAPTG